MSIKKSGIKKIATYNIICPFIDFFTPLTQNYAIKPHNRNADLYQPLRHFYGTIQHLCGKPNIRLISQIASKKDKFMNDHSIEFFPFTYQSPIQIPLKYFKFCQNTKPVPQEKIY